MIAVLLYILGCALSFACGWYVANERNRREWEVRDIADRWTDGEGF